MDHSGSSGVVSAYATSVSISSVGGCSFCSGASGASSDVDVCCDESASKGCDSELFNKIVLSGLTEEED